MYIKFLLFYLLLIDFSLSCIRTLCRVYQISSVLPIVNSFFSVLQKKIAAWCLSCLGMWWPQHNIHTSTPVPQWSGIQVLHGWKVGWIGEKDEEFRNNGFFCLDGIWDTVTRPIFQIVEAFLPFMGFTAAVKLTGLIQGSSFAQVTAFIKLLYLFHEHL